LRRQVPATIGNANTHSSYRLKAMTAMPTIAPQKRAEDLSSVMGYYQWRWTILPPKYPMTPAINGMERESPR
jgi:hypothetical protein